MNSSERYREWMDNPCFDEDTKKELAGIADNPGEIEDRFYRDLEFGTGGLRGVIGAGTNRMNLYTVTKATQGLANYIIAQGCQEKGVAIAFDSRHMSLEFSQAAALCLNANGIPTWRFESLRPTPELSFAVRQLGCTAGIVVTASHNPPEYNGYKVYWEDGCQITAPRDKEIIEEVNKVTDYRDVKTMTREEAQERGLFHVLGEEMDRAYLDAVKSLVIHPEVIRAAASRLKIVYTPLCGTGFMPVTRILKELGFSHVYTVKEQSSPDGDFPTLKSPNPEDKNAFALALELAREKDADLVLATDPDADRLGVYALDRLTGQYRAFTGNMSGSLIAEYLLRERRKAGTLPLNGALVTTIVTTNMVWRIAERYQVDVIEVLTGFKYIGEQMGIFEKTGRHEYVFGLEESYGCLTGEHARDKDAVAAVTALCEAAAYEALEGKTLWDEMMRMYETYGYYREDQVSVVMKGATGAEKIKALMEAMRSKPFKEIGDQPVIAVRDYREGIRRSMKDGRTETLALPSSNVLYYELPEDGWCCARPSGTEPKIKFYMGVRGRDLEDADAKLQCLKEALLSAVDACQLDDSTQN